MSYPNILFYKPQRFLTTCLWIHFLTSFLQIFPLIYLIREQQLKNTTERGEINGWSVMHTLILIYFCRYSLLFTQVLFPGQVPLFLKLPLSTLASLLICSWNFTQKQHSTIAEPNYWSSHYFLAGAESWLIYESVTPSIDLQSSLNVSEQFSSLKTFFSSLYHTS